MSESDCADLGRAARIALVLRQAAPIEPRRAGVEPLKRGDARQAAPPSKGERVQAPERPGREPGQGMFERREPPAPERPSEPPIDVPVPEAAGPDRGGPLGPGRVGEASLTDLPEVVRPRVRLFRGAGKRGLGRGRSGRGRPRERAVAATYRAPCDAIREASSVHADATGWRVRGRPARPRALVTDAATAYPVRDRRRDEGVRERLPADYAGAMLADRGKGDDAAEFAGGRRPVGPAHVPRSIAEVVEAKAGEARWFGAGLKGPWKRASASPHGRREGPGPDFEARAHQLERGRTGHPRDRALGDDANRRSLDGPGRHQAAGPLVRSPGDPTIGPTNDRAERAPRPAVLAREVSRGTRTARGTRAFEAGTSVPGAWGRTRSGGALLDAIGARAYPVVSDPV